MQRKIFILLLSLWGVFSCTREGRPAAGSLRIAFVTGALQTKTDGPDGVVADGGGIFIDGSGVPDLVILIANSSGDIVATYPSSGREGEGIKTGSLEGAATATNTSVSFSGLAGNATYTVYALANTQGLWTLNNATALTSLTTLAATENLQFAPVAGDKEASGSLKVLNSRLPISAKGTVELSSLGNGEVTLPLLRCVAKVTAVFENQYGEDLTLYTFNNTFYHMLPSTGYVIPHDSDFPETWASAGNLSDDESSLAIADGGTTSETWYVFPSIGPYTCDVSFYLEDPATDPNPATNPIHEYSDLPVHDDHARDIPQLARNQHLTITTRIGKGKNVSFNFEVTDWETKREEVTFN